MKPGASKSKSKTNARTTISDLVRLSGRKVRTEVSSPMGQWRRLPLERREELMLRESAMDATGFRRFLQEKTGIRFRNDSQVTRARAMTVEDRALVSRSERAERFESFWRQENLEATDAEVRKAVLGFLMMEAAATEEVKLSINAARELREMDRLDLDRDKFEELRKQADKADQADRVAKDRDLTEEEKKERYAQIFGLG